jgi:hypothetical protein
MQFYFLSHDLYKYESFIREYHICRFDFFEQSALGIILVHNIQLNSKKNLTHCDETSNYTSDRKFYAAVHCVWLWRRDASEAKDLP